MQLEKPQTALSETEQRDHLPTPLEGAPGGGIIVEKNVMVPMRDRVRLATDIYRPAEKDRYPVVLIRTPYGSKTPEHAKRAELYVKRGYALAVQDCRGKYDSEGDWYGKRNEAQDGSDTITWLGTRPWSSGKVGMTGGSYLGMVQYWLADQQNPYLRALVPIVAPTTLGRERTEYDRLSGYSCRQSYHANLSWMMLTDGRVNQFTTQGPSVTTLKVRDHLPLMDYPKILGREMKWWRFLLTHQNGFWEEYHLRASIGEWSEPIADEAWWESYKDRYRKVSVPMLHIAGWYDCCGEPQIKMFQLIREHAIEPLARNHQRLILGPWSHCIGGTKLNDFDFGTEAQFDVDIISVRWFDRWLKGLDNGIDREPAVRVFLMGENRWRDADDWPIPGTKFTKYYLHSKGDARLTHGGGYLSTDPPGEEPADRYTYDPGDPTPEVLTADKNWIVGPVNRVSVEERDDVLVYTTESLTEPVEVTGPLSAVIYLATSAPSTCLFVRLIDVFPEGTPYPVFVTIGDPYRTHWAKEVERRPDGTSIVKADVELPMTGNVFRAGHRIRVEISSAAAPTFRGINVDPATEPYATRWNRAEQRVYHDRAHPSCVLLPLILRREGDLR